jgi:hypothetical protein
MILVELFFAVLVALVLSWLLVAVLGWQRPAREGTWASIMLVFVLLFLFIWAGGVWVSPFGPALWGAYFLPFLVVGLALTLLFAAVIPPRRPRTPREAIEEARTEAAIDAAFSAFFWVLVVVLVVSIVAHYAL